MTAPLSNVGNSQAIGWADALFSRLSAGTIQGPTLSLTGTIDAAGGFGATLAAAINAGISAGTAAAIASAIQRANHTGTQPAASLAFAATKTLAGRNTAGAGTGEEVTADQVIDWIGTPAAGDLLYRGSSAYARLAAGTGAEGSLLFLTTAGSPTPVWSTKWTVSAAGTLTGATGSLTGASVPALAVTQTWNNAGTTFVAASVTVTDTNSASGSTLWGLGKAATADWLSVKSEADIGNATAGRCHIYSRLFTVKSYYGSALLTNGPDAANGFKVGYSSAAYLDISQNTLGIIQPAGNCYLATDAADKLALRNSTTAQSWAVYNTYTSGTNHECGVFDWKTTANLFRIVTQAGSAGGTIRSMMVGSGAAVGNNVPGVDTTIIGGQGTGTGTGGNILLQCAPAGSSGTAVNALATKVTVGPSGVNIAGNTTFGGLLVINDAYGLLLGSTTGSQIATGTTQKLAFWGKTPVVQPASASQAAITDTAGATYTAAEQTMLANLKTLVNQIRADLVTVGLIKGSA